MHLLNVEDVSIDFGDKPLFKGVSFGINLTDKIGLIGSNGSGKSTLALIVAGQLEPDTGEVTLSGDTKIHYLPQNPVFDPNNSILREVFRGEDPVLNGLYQYHGLTAMLEAEQSSQLVSQISSWNVKLDSLGAWEIESSARAALTKLGITDLERKVQNLSGGELKRIALARALITPCQLLILDEPTNHLDSEAILWLEGFLQKRAGALILITHDRWLLNRVSNRIIEVDRGDVLDCVGGYQSFLEYKEEVLEMEQAAARKHRAALKRELTWLRQGAQGRSTKEKIRKQRYQELADQSFKEKQGKVELDIPSQRLGKKVIELQGISKSIAGQKLVSDFSYTLLPRDRIGIVGPNGSGKSTLLNIIAGLIEPDTGCIERGETVKVGYYRQEAGELDDSLRVIQYIEGIRMSVKTASGETLSAAKMLERFLFFGPDQWTFIRDLSGGERRRLYLLGVLMEEPNVLILDEPTNDLDIETLTVLEDFLEEFPGAVISVSHDRWFLDKTTDHLFALDGTGNVQKYTGSFSDYLTQNLNVQQGVSAEKTEDNRPKRKKTKLSYKEQKEFHELEEAIALLEEELTKLKEDLVSAGSDYVKLNEIHSQTEELEQDLEEKMERWLELQELKEQLEG